MEILALKDSIFYVKALLSPDLCRSCIELFTQDPHKHPGYTASVAGERQLESDVKVSTDLDVGTEGAWLPVFNELHAAVSGVIQSIAAQFPSLQMSPLRCTGYKIQHYRRNEGHFKWHVDAYGPGGWDRQLAAVIYLNSVEDGGETCFHRQDIQVKPVAGNALFFPPFWTHLHCAQIPRSGDKYIISTFIRQAIPGIEDPHRTCPAPAAARP